MSRDVDKNSSAVGKKNNSQIKFTTQAIFFIKSIIQEYFRVETKKIPEITKESTLLVKTS